jgi:hypothetical protein
MISRWLDVRPSTGEGEGKPCYTSSWVPHVQSANARCLLARGAGWDRNRKEGHSEEGNGQEGRMRYTVDSSHLSEAIKKPKTRKESCAALY